MTYGIFDTYEGEYVATGFITRQLAAQRLSEATKGFGGDISPDVAEACEVRDMSPRGVLLHEIREEAVGIRGGDDVVNRAYDLADLVLAFLALEDS